MGYEFVELERLARGLVRVTIDTTAEGGISLEDCERVSDELAHLFTVEDIPYERLEVSSPGVERPLKRARDWDRFAGELDGRIISIEGESGAETITFDFFEVFIARTPTAAVTALRGRRKKTAEVPPVRVTFPLSDVDNAHLLAELNFKG